MAEDTPRVSIILPTFNRQALLPRSIDSVLHQSYENWDLVVWNDGSTDRTTEILQTYTDKRISYVSAENYGMSFALNEAIKIVSGDFVAFLDDDDQWCESKLELQVNILLQNREIDLVFGNFNNYYENKKLPGLAFDQTVRAMSALTTKSIGPKVKVIQEGFLEGLARDNFIAFDSTIIRRKVLDSIGPFNQHLRNGMDLEYWWRFGLAGYKAAFTYNVVLNRFKYANSLSGGSVVSVSNHIKALDSCANHAREYLREDTLDYLQPAYRNAWQNMISACAMENDKKGMMAAFRQTLKYGFRPGSLRLLLEGLLKGGAAR